MNYLTPRAANMHEDMKASLAFYFWICVWVQISVLSLSPSGYSLNQHVFDETI